MSEQSAYLPGTSGRDERQEQVDLSPPSRCGHVHTGNTRACSCELLSRRCWPLSEGSRAGLQRQALSLVARQRRWSSAPPLGQGKAETPVSGGSAGIRGYAHQLLTPGADVQGQGQACSSGTTARWPGAVSCPLLSVSGEERLRRGRRRVWRRRRIRGRGRRRGWCWRLWAERHPGAGFCDPCAWEGDLRACAVGAYIGQVGGPGTVPKMPATKTVQRLLQAGLQLPTDVQSLWQGLRGGTSLERTAQMMALPCCSEGQSSTSGNEASLPDLCHRTVTADIKT